MLKGCTINVNYTLAMCHPMADFNIQIKSNICVARLLTNVDVQTVLNAHTHWAIHNHTDHIFDRSLVGIFFLFFIFLNSFISPDIK